MSDKGFEASPTLVRGLLHTMGHSLQGVAKQNEGAQHPDRDSQFRYITERCGEFLAAGQPVIGLDWKEKELVGDYANGGAEWQAGGEPERAGVKVGVSTGDPPSRDQVKATRRGRSEPSITSWYDARVTRNSWSTTRRCRSMRSSAAFWTSGWW